MKLRKLIAALAVFASAWLSKAQEADIMDIASLTSQGSYEVALDSLRLMAQRDSLDDAVWYYIGVCHSQMGRGTEAASAFLKAQELDPNNPDYRAFYILDQIGLEAVTTSWRQSASANRSKSSPMTYRLYSAFPNPCACRAIGRGISPAYSHS